VEAAVRYRLEGVVVVLMLRDLGEMKHTLTRIHWKHRLGWWWSRTTMDGVHGMALLLGK
jgi:hypothetical protein